MIPKLIGWLSVRDNITFFIALTSFGLSLQTSKQKSTFHLWRIIQVAMLSNMARSPKIKERSFNSKLFTSSLLRLFS